jgi:hypothetical protein
MPELLLRTFVDCGSDREAVAISRKLIVAAAPFRCEPSGTPGPYWKKKQLWEFGFWLHPPTQSTLDELVARTDGGWLRSDEDAEEPWAVWNRQRDLTFLAAEVAWAELQLIAHGTGVSEPTRSRMH